MAKHTKLVELVALAAHPENDDPTACIVAEERGKWVIFRCRAGYLLTSYRGTSVLKTYPTEAAARKDANRLFG